MFGQGRGREGERRSSFDTLQAVDMSSLYGLLEGPLLSGPASSTSDNVRSDTHSMRLSSRPELNARSEDRNHDVGLALSTCSVDFGRGRARWRAQAAWTRQPKESAARGNLL
jgi:hypothetical protein